MNRKEKLEKARRDELLAGNKVNYGELKEGTPEYEKAYKDWSEKFWDLKKQQQLDDNLYDAEGCLKLIIYLFVIGFVSYWVIKLLFSIKYW